MKFIKGLIKFIAFLIILVIGGIGVIFFLISSPKKEIDTTWTQNDFNSYLEKGGIEFNDSHASAEDFFANNLITAGSTSVDTTVSNEELSAIANMSINQNSVVKDIKIKCHDNNEIEMSCRIGDLTPLIEQFPVLKQFESGLKLIENKPVYMNSTLLYNKSTKLFEGVTKELYVGKIKIPIDKANNGLEPGGTAINNAIKQLDGFSVNEFEVNSDGFKFDGTIPTEIQSAKKFINY